MAEERKGMTKKEGTFDKDLIRELAELLEETGLTEIEIEHEGKRVRVARTVTVGAGALVIDAGRGPREAGEAGGKEERHHPGTVHSPMVGTA
jgi:acetyl-CoA carboxylase biotin carboxyl carrier protein